MKMIPPEKRFGQALLELARTQNLWSVFNDFLDYALLLIRWWDVKANDFAELEKKYPEQRHAHLFAEAYTAMADVADNDGTGFKDPFGDFFMEHLSNNYKGQFFTPETLCEFKARILIGSELSDNATIVDPCCGSGRLLLAAAKINRKATFYAMDIDLTCCKMTVLNFMMNTMCGEVAWMNSLTGKHWKSWHTKKILNSNGYYLPYYVETESGQTDVVKPLPIQPKEYYTEKTLNNSKNAEKWKEKQTQQLRLKF